ncbi:hypothetical protein TNCV_3456831 [Trichonephila clavipes]|nr:hypothetical protein TNCV_3456831 [Trichonephila clavipes]
MAASSKTPPHLSKGPQKLKTPLQVPVFPGISLLCRHTSCEKTIRLHFIPLGPGLPQDFVASKIKDNIYSRAFGDGPRHFEQWSSDEDDPSPNYRTPSTGVRLSSRQI